MTWPARVAVPGCLFLLLAPETLAAQQAAALDSASRAFVDRARAAAVAYRDPAAARLAGYRRIGPDFPGMGEHWINLPAAVAGTLDPSVPTILTYADRDGAPALLGVAYALPLGPGQEPPTGPLRPDVWHDHSGSVDEELALHGHPTSMEHASAKGYRIAVVHVWTEFPNPDGVLAQHNWSLPFWRAGLGPPDRGSAQAGRGVSLAHGRAFYREMIRTATPLTDPDREAVEAALEAAAAAAEAEVERQRSRSGPGGADAGPFEEIWEAFWLDLRGNISAAAWAGLADMADLRAADTPTPSPNP